MHPNSFLPSLPPSIAHEILHTLETTLPPPAADSAVALAARIETAMATVAAYAPTDAAEAQLAAQIVAADARAKDSFRIAVLPGQNPDTTRRCRAQAASMMRLMQSGQRLLQRTQAIRQKAEAEMRPEAMERAGWWFRDVSVLAPEPDQPAVPDPVAATPATPPASAARAEPAFETLIEAEQYALIYPRRAALIRDHGGLPSRLDFGPPEPEIVEALVRGSSSILRALDQQPRRPFAAAA